MYIDTNTHKSILMQLHLSCKVNDMETPSPTTTAAWTQLHSSSHELISRVEAAFKHAGHPSLAWYDALLEIEKAGRDGIRPYQLRERLLLPQYGTSRLLERLLKSGYITRETVNDDGRGQTIHTTEQGSKLRKAMWPIYAQIIIDSVEEKLSMQEAKQLATLLGKLQAS